MPPSRSRPAIPASEGCAYGRPHAPTRPDDLWPFAAAAVAAVGLVLATPAAAVETVTVEVLGEIEASCALSAGAILVDLGMLQQGTERTFELGVDCNAPFTYGLVSQNGGLQHQGSIAFVGDFTVLLPYEIDVTIPLTDGDAPIADSCTSASIADGSVSCVFTDSGDAVAISETVAFRARWDTATHLLLAGIYADELTFTVAVQP